MGEARALGFRPEDFSRPPHSVWPENWLAVELFIDMGTQWRTSMGGLEGLEYLVLFRFLDELEVDRKTWRELFEDVRHLELCALEMIRENQQQ